MLASVAPAARWLDRRRLGGACRSASEPLAVQPPSRRRYVLPLRRANVNLYPSIELPSLGGVIRRFRPRFAVTDRGDARRRDALVDQIAAHRGGALLGKSLVVRRCADRIGVAFDGDLLVRIVAEV